MEPAKGGGRSAAYNRAAYSLVNYHSLRNNDGSPSAWVTPGYPILLAALYWVFGYNFHIVVFANAVLLTIAYWTMFQACRHWLGSGIALGALALWLLNLRASMFVGYIYTECLFFACVGGILFSLARSARGGWVWVIATGAIFGYAVLTRPVALGALPLLLLFTATRRSFSRAAIVGLLAVLPISLWVLRNERLLGQPLLSTNSPYAMAEGNQDFYRRFRFWDLYATSGQVKPYADLSVHHPWREVEEALQVQSGFREWRAQNQTFYYWLVTWRMKTLLSPYTFDMSARNRLISLVLWLITFPPAVAAIFLCRSRRLACTAFLAAGLSMLLIPSLAVVGNSLRYQIPAQILLIPAAASLYYALFRRIRERIFFPRTLQEQS